MEVQGQQKAVGRGTVYAVLVIMCMLLGGTVVYYNSALSQQTSSSNSTESQLQQQIQGLQATISELKANQTGTAGTNSTALAIYKEASPSVVTIEGDQVTTEQTIFGPYTTYSVVEGSGFVTDYQGTPYIITNYHVVDGTSNMTVTFSDGDAYLGKIVGDDVYADLAVVSVDAPATEYHPLTILDSSGLTVGQAVYAIGAPFGLSGTFTSGLISQLGRTITEETTGNYSISGIIQFTAPINPGNSGGPLLDSAGEVVGITTATISGSQGLGFAIPSHTILRELPSLISTGSYLDHSYLGIGGVDMDYQLAQASKTNVTYGVLIESVTSGGPASSAGIKAGTTEVSIAGSDYYVGGDIIVSVNGTRVVGTDALSSYLEENTVAGQHVVFGIIRAGAAINVTVTLGARPQP
jgi:S1-C subfamily serine protease